MICCFSKMMMISRFHDATRLRLLVITMATSLTTPAGFAQSSQPSLDSNQVQTRIDAILNDFHKTTGLPGATIGYVLSDGTGGSVSVGLADKEKRISMRADHRLMAGSTGKTFFAALALQLVDEGELDLEGKISQWLGNEVEIEPDDEDNDDLLLLEDDDD